MIEPGVAEPMYEISSSPIPYAPTMAAAYSVADWRSPAGPVPASPKWISSAAMPPIANCSRAFISDLVIVKRSSSSPWARSPSDTARFLIERTSRVRALPSK